MKNRVKHTNRYHVYIVKCADRTYYTGYTVDLEKRLKLHNKGNGAKYLRGRLPVQLVYTKKYRFSKDALHAERNIKKLRRAEKEKLIRIYKYR